MKKLLLFCILLPILSFGQNPTEKIDTTSKRISTIEKNIVKINDELSQINSRFDSCKVQCKRSECQIKCCKCDDKERNKIPGKDYLPLLIALLTAVFALYEQKRNNVTQSRIRWIEELRKYISEFLSIMRSINVKISNMIDAIKKLDHQSATYKSDSDKIFDDHYKDIEEIHTKALQLLNQINMSLNDDEIKHKTLIDKLNELGDKAKESYQKDHQENLEGLEEECIALSKSILKEEWKKVKRIP